MAPSWRILSSFTFSLAALFIVQPCLVGAQCDIPPLTLTWANLSVTQDGLGVARGIELGMLLTAVLRPTTAVLEVSAVLSTRLSRHHMLYRLRANGMVARLMMKTTQEAMSTLTMMSRFKKMVMLMDFRW